MTDPSTRTVTRRVKFFRLTAHTKDALSQVPLDGVDWTELIQDLAGQSYAERQFSYSDNDYVFEGRDTGLRHFAIHRLKKESDFLSQVALDGAVSEIMAVDEEGSLADTTAGVFLRHNATFAVVAGNQAAPRASAVAQFLNAVQPFAGDLVYNAEALVTKPNIERLYKRSGARKVKVALPVGELDGEAIDDGSPGGLLRQLSGQMPGARIELTISYGRSRPPHGAAEKLAGLSQDLAENLGPDGRAEATMFDEREGKVKGKTRVVSEIVDIVQHQIAEEFSLPARQDGVRIDSMLQAIDFFIEKNTALIARAWEDHDGSEGAGTPG